MKKFPEYIKSEDKHITVSETFYSIQGEGRYIGTPSVFLRTQGCILNCEWCDTYNVWKSGISYSYEEFLNLWKERGIFQMLKKPDVHLILTGGEPLLRQKEISEFLIYLIVNKEISIGELIGKIEIETSGTIHPDESFLYSLSPQFNVSPKLANSGMELMRRNREYAMKYFSSISWDTYGLTSQATFKFVVKNREDVEEAIMSYIDPYSINKSSVYLMAEAQTREQLQEREGSIVELAKEFGFNYSTRLHLHIWNKATGV